MKCKAVVVDPKDFVLGNSEKEIADDSVEGLDDDRFPSGPPTH